MHARSNRANAIPDWCKLQTTQYLRGEGAKLHDLNTTGFHEAAKSNRDLQKVPIPQSAIPNIPQCFALFKNSTMLWAAKYIEEH